MSVIAKEATVGQEFSGKPKSVAWERLWTFSGGPFSSSGWPRKNIHTDPEFAMECGLSSVAVSATQFQGYMAELMIQLFGKPWLSHGEMCLKFVKLVPQGDVLTCKAVVRSREETGNGVRFSFDAWCENKHGEKVALGSATGVLS